MQIFGIFNKSLAEGLKPIMTEKRQTVDSAEEWKPAVYQADEMIGSNFSIISCAEAFLPILNDFGIPSGSCPVITYKYDETSQNGIFGDTHGPHFKFSIYDGRNEPSNGYSGNLGGMSLRSLNLVHQETGEKLEISVSAEFPAWTSNQIHLNFAGECQTVEKLKAAIKPFLGN